MGTLFKFIGYNLASIIFLIFTAWALNNGHIVFAIVAFIVALGSGIIPNTKDKS